MHVIVLAAGIAERFGSQKLLHPLEGGDTLLARAVRAAGEYPVVVVCGAAVEPHAQRLGARTVRNDSPDRGMAHSLRLADGQIHLQSAIVVLPGDLLLIEPEHVAAIVAASGGVDVAYPVRSDGTPGHPVVFSSRARELVDRLHSNEPIAHVRDAAELTRKMITVDEPWPYRDVDAPSDLP